MSGVAVLAACAALMMLPVCLSSGRSATARHRSREWPGALAYFTGAVVMCITVLS